MPRDLPADIQHPQIPPSLAQYAIPLSSWKSQHTSYRALVVGALVLRTSPTGNPELLLLKRASTDSFPNVFEPPGGSVDDTDETILHSVVRELWEETGLRVQGFGAGRVVRDDEGERRDRAGEEGVEKEVTFFGRSSKDGKWCKLNFLLNISKENGEEVVVSLDEEEHQDWGWFERDAAKKLPFVSEQSREIVMNAFDAFDDIEK